MASHAPITGAPMRATIIPFPDRGGGGFRAHGKLTRYSTVNVCLPAPPRIAEPSIPTFNPSDPAHVAAWEALFRFSQMGDR